MRHRRTLFLVALASGCGDPGIRFPPDGAGWPAVPVPEWMAAPRLVLTDNGDDTLAYVTPGEQPKLLDLVPIGNLAVELEGPHHIATSADGQVLYVPLSNYVPGSGSGPHGAHGTGNVPGSLVKLRARDHARLGEAQVDRSPGDVITTRDGRLAIVSHYDLLRLKTQVQRGLPEADGYSTIALVDTATMALPALHPICPTAHGMALSADEKTLYVSCSESDELAIMDLATFQVQRIKVGPERRAPLDPAYGPYAIVRSPLDGSLWISCTRSGDLRVFDPRRGVMDDARRVPVGGVPFFGAFLSDGKTLLLPHQGDEKLSFVDTARSREISRLALNPKACERPHALLISPDDRLAYLVCEGDHVTRPGTLVTIDIAGRALLGFTAVGLYPDGIAALPAIAR